MENCDKLKKRFYLGILMIFSIGLLKVIAQNFIGIIDILGKGLSITFVLVLGIWGLYLALPYVTCISNNNTRGKPRY